MSSETLLFTVAAGRRTRRALRRPPRAAGVAAVPGVPRVRPRAAATGHADGRRAHRRARPRGAHPRDRRRVARLAVPPDASGRRHRAVRHPAVHDGRLAVRRLARGASGSSSASRCACSRACTTLTPETHDLAFLDRPKFGADALDQHLDYQRWYYDWARDGETVPLIERTFAALDKTRPAEGPDRPQLGRQPHRQHDVPRLRARGRPRLGDGRARAGRGRRGVDDLPAPLLRGPHASATRCRASRTSCSATSVAEIYLEESGRELHDLEWYEMFAAQRFAIVSIRTTLRTVAYGDAEAARRPRRRDHVPQPARGDGRTRRGRVTRDDMTWEPPARPEWVQAVNAGGILPIAEVAELPFARDALLAEARATLGRAPTAAWPTSASDDFLEPLDVLLPALEHEAELTVIGRWMTRRFLLRFLEVRLQLTEYVRRDPGVVDEEIDAPWFVTGAPRTGTTILHALLAQDPTSRVPEGWELLRPVPPPDPDPERVRRRRPHPARRPRAAPARARSRASSTPSTCTAAACTRSACRRCRSRSGRRSSPRATTCRRTSSGTSAATSGPRTTCTGSCCRCCNAARGNVHWVLKSPVHVSALPTLLAVYPDARLAITHRDPLTVLASLTSLVATLRWAHSDRVDFAEIGALPRTHVDRARSTTSPPRRPTARSTPRACTTCTTPTSCRTRSA